jgi:hypothetical protein
MFESNRVLNPCLTAFQVQPAPSARVPRPLVVFPDSLAFARITAPGFPRECHAKSCLIKGSQGFSSESRVGRWSLLTLSLRSYNRSLLPTRKSLKILRPTSAEPSSARWFFLPSFTRTVCVQRTYF